MRRRRRVPPLTMQGCGHTERTWTYRERCSACLVKNVDVVEPGGETLREFRRRVIDPKQNA